jgi:hypothetical protein
LEAIERKESSDQSESALSPGEFKARARPRPSERTGPGAPPPSPPPSR